MKQEKISGTPTEVDEAQHAYYRQAWDEAAQKFEELLGTYPDDGPAHTFLKRTYERIDVVFIPHHTVAKEVEEEDFFHSRESGGTVVSSALKLMVEVIHDRYPPSQWNIYCAQASDGDN